VDVEAIDGGGTKLAGFADRNFPTAHAKKQLAMCCKGKLQQLCMCMYYTRSGRPILEARALA